MNLSKLAQLDESDCGVNVAHPVVESDLVERGQSTGRPAMPLLLGDGSTVTAQALAMAATAGRRWLHAPSRS